MFKGKGKAKGGFAGVQQSHLKQAGAAGGGGYKTTLCKFFLEGTCQKGDACTFSHGEEPEARMPTDSSSTPCKFFAEGMCAKGDACEYQHAGGSKGGKKGFAKGFGGGFGGGFAGLGPGGGFAKGAAASWKGAGKAMEQKGGQMPCKFFAMGTCAKGWDCPFAHGPSGGAKGGKGAAFGKGSFGKGSFGKDKGKGLKGKGHLLPRTRISEAPFSGIVAEWKGKYGWITPAETIEHEKAEKHGGRLFVGKDDIVGADALEAGATVEFHIWEDVSGLGCEEVTVF